MTVSKKDVEHVAKLARLGLSEEEKELFAKQLSDILKFADGLKKVKTDGIEPTSHAIPMKNVWREDKVVTFENLASIINNGPVTENGQFWVPKILE